MLFLNKELANEVKIEIVSLIANGRRRRMCCVATASSSECSLYGMLTWPQAYASRTAAPDTWAERGLKEVSETQAAIRHMLSLLVQCLASGARRQNPWQTLSAGRISKSNSSTGVIIILLFSNAIEHSSRSQR